MKERQSAMSSSTNELFRYAELFAFKTIGAYRIGKLLNPKAVLKGAKVAGKVNDNNASAVRILLGETPLYRNIGDLAIAVAEKQYLDNLHAGVVKEYTENNRWFALAYWRRLIKPDTTIVLQGGGNMGERYFGLDLKRAGVIKAFPHNRIVVMPQTSDYNGKLGAALLTYMRNIYIKHGDVHLFARERRSYELMKRQFKGVDVRLVTDIVMTYRPEFDNQPTRSGALIILRQDGERLQANDLCGHIKAELNTMFDTADIRSSDTIYHCDVSYEERETVVLNKMREFASAEVVVTDRLHGMIFAAITGTPCVAFDNANHKISASYNAWLKNVPYIALSSPETLGADIRRVLQVEHRQYDFKAMLEHCSDIKKLLKCE